MTTEADGSASFTLSAVLSVEPGEFITGTATDPGNNTSQFSLGAMATGEEYRSTKSLPADPVRQEQRYRAYVTLRVTNFPPGDCETQR